MLISFDKGHLQDQDEKELLMSTQSGPLNEVLKSKFKA
jgi:hypothetical protein